MEVTHQATASASNTGEAQEAGGSAPASEAEARRPVATLEGADLNSVAEELEATLRANPDALLEHFVKTATVFEVKKVAAGEWAEAGNDHVSTLRAAVHLRLTVGSFGRP